ncbi:hypothetical protein MT418_003045 [Batrachochytrium dendrobatidis]
MTTASISASADSYMNGADRRQEGSRRMGTYMLTGWVLMNDMCSNKGCNLPVFRNKERTKTVCCMCDDPHSPILPVISQPAASQLTNKDSISMVHQAQDKQTSDSITLTEEEEMELLAAMDERHEVDRSTEQDREQSERASDLIGQKMLQGWTLLQNVCRSCPGIPLVRNRQNQTLCVICKQSGDELDDIAESIHVKPESVAMDQDDPICGQKRSFEKILTVSPTPHVHSDSVKNPFQSTANALTDKVIQLSIKLETTTNVQAITAIADAISSCMRAIELLSRD